MVEILIFKYSCKKFKIMVKKVIEASEAVAIAANLCRPELVAAYPITPQRI